MILAEKIALLRRQIGWSQEELANQLNVSRQAVSKWEGGVGLPDINTLEPLADALGLTLSLIHISEPTRH